MPGSQQQKLPQRVSSWRCAFVAWHLWWQGMTQEAILLFSGQKLQTLVSWKKWREAHFAQMSSMKSQFAAWYWVHWTLTAGSWADILHYRMPPPSWPVSPLPSQRDGQGGRKQRTDALETTEWARGHTLLWTFRQPLLSRPARFSIMLNYYAE